MLVLIAAVGLRVLAVAALTVAPLIWPETDEPSRADAVIVLSGDHGERLARAMPLIERGVARTLVFDGTIDRAEERELCQSRGTVEYVCLRPQPDSTRAEARAAARLAESRGWRKLIVVTSDYHVTRARMLFRRCFDGQLEMVAGAPPIGRAEQARQTAREWAKVAYLLTLDRKC